MSDLRYNHRVRKKLFPPRLREEQCGWGRRAVSMFFSSVSWAGLVYRYRCLKTANASPGRAQTILTSRNDKADGKIRRCGRNKGERLKTPLEWTARGRIVVASPLYLPLSLFLYLLQIACSREESHTVFRRSRTQLEKSNGVPRVRMSANRRCITDERKSHVIGNDLPLRAPPRPEPIVLSTSKGKERVYIYVCVGKR